MGDRDVNHSNWSIREPASQIWYIDANNLFVTQWCKSFEYINITLDEGWTTLQRILNTPDDSDLGHYIVCDFEYTNSCKERTEQPA